MLREALIVAGLFSSSKGAMASLDSPTELAILDEAFEVSWAAVAAYNPFRDFKKDYELRFALRRKLFALAAGDMRDPEAMRTKILATLTL
jgi:hypothetical protein